jgi:hypothetical protein
MPPEVSDSLKDSDTFETDDSDTSDDVGHAMLTLHEDRIRRTDLAIMAYQQSVNVTAADARRAHLRNKVAWGVTGGLTAIAFIGAVWATHTVTKARAEVDHLTKVVRQLTDTTEGASAQVSQLRDEAQTAKVNAARTQGQLEAAREQIEQLTKVQHQVGAPSAEALPAAHSAQSSASPTTAPPPTVTSATTQPAVSLGDIVDRLTLR